MRGARGVLVAACSMLIVAVSASPGATAVRGDWAEWEPFTGGRGGWETSLRLPGLGGVLTTVSSDATSATRPSGAATWQGPVTPPGAVFGSSRDRGYANLGLAASSAPSTTEYTFAQPPAQGWAFVLSDIDADSVTISAVTTDGAEATAAELGFQGAFNFCDDPPRPTCAGTTAPGDRPRWDPTTSTLSGGGLDTTGASGWFRPSVPLRSLSVEFSRQSGFPIYQTWFAGQTREISGTIGAAGGACDPTTATVSLRDGDEVLARTVPAVDGTYSFAPVAARPGLVVRLGDRPDGCGLQPGQAVVLPVDPGAADDPDLDFAVEELSAETVTVTGVLDDADGAPVAGAVIDFTGPVDAGPDADEERVVTGDDGGFRLVDIEPGTYTAVLTVPEGFEAEAATIEVTVPTVPGTIELDFGLTALPPTPPAPEPTVDPSPSPSPAPTTAPPSPDPTPSAASPPVSQAGADAAGTPASSPVTSGLPDTGGPEVGLLWLGLGLLVAGVATSVTARRPRQPGADR